MIEVCENNVWYKRKRKKIKFKKLFCIFLVFSIILSVFFYYKNYVSKQILTICADYSDACATESVNKAVIDTLKEEIKYSDLILIEKNQAGDISLMTANSYKINAISREISEKSLENLSKKLDAGVPVPLLSFSGIKLLAGYGKSINYKPVYISNIVCNFTSSFKSVGINQTLHSIYIDVNTETKLEMPLNNVARETNSSVLVCETIILGKVPETYLNGKLF